MTQSEKNIGNRVVYSDPENLAAALTRRTQLAEEISDISTQLSDRNKQDRCTACNGKGCNACDNKGGARWTNERFHTWRKSAITALRARENVLRRLNTWIETHDKAGDEPDVLFAKAHQLLKNLEEDDVEFEPEEREVIESLGAYLKPKQKLARTGT